MVHRQARAEPGDKHGNRHAANVNAIATANVDVHQMQIKPIAQCQIVLVLRNADCWLVCW